MGKQRSLRSKAVNLVSDLTTVLLNPISDKPITPLGNHDESQKSQPGSVSETGPGPGQGDGEGEVSIEGEGPDTSSFTAFLYSLLKDDYFVAQTDEDSKPQPQNQLLNVNVVKDSGANAKKGMLSRGKQSIGKAVGFAARFAGFRSHGLDRKSSSVPDNNQIGEDVGVSSILKSHDEELPLVDLPDMSHTSVLLSSKTRLKLYASLPTLAKGRKWVLLYSTWRNGISLSTLYRKSMLCPGLSLLVVGDRGGSVFGGLVEAPLKPSKSRRYQGTNSTFLFSDAPGQLAIYRPTGANHYYTCCSPDYLALGGGSHFALYLDSDLLNGSSAASETYGNGCLALSEDFEVKEIELWGFVYASRYEEVLALSQNEAPGICRW